MKSNLFSRLRSLYEITVKIRTKVGEFFTGLPFWSDVERISMIVAGPVKGVATIALLVFPFLKRFERYLEIESLKKRPPVILALSIVFLIFRGLMTSPNGHIGTDFSVFPALTLVSAFNPFLGGLCGCLFGAADLLQKFVHPDIYGAMSRNDPNYSGAMVGYLIAYSAPVWMGVVPGVMTRIGRNIAISIVMKLWRARVAANADGAIPPGQEALAGGAGIVGGAIGGLIAAYTGVRFIVPVLERPAFFNRPTPDESCYKSELMTLRAQAPRVGAAGIIGGAIVGTTPATPPPGSPPGGGRTPPPLNPDDGLGTDGEPIDPEENPWQVPGPDGKMRYFATQEDAQDYCDELVRGEERHQAEDDLKNATEQIAFLESIRRGLSNSGRDTSSQDREIERWRRNQDQAKSRVRELGGSTDYQARERSDWTFGEHDELLRQQKEKRELLRDIHKTSKATRNLAEKGRINYGEGQTDNILERLDKWSKDLATGGGEPPTRDELEKIRQILRGEMDAAKARETARNTNWVKEGAQGTSREIFTGVDADGNTSYKTMALRGLMGVATGGQSEYVMEVGDKMYVVHDEVMKGKSGLEAFGTAATRVLTDEFTGRVIEGGIAVGGKAGGAGYSKFVKGSSLDEALTSGSKKTKDFLNQDVGDLMSKGSGERGGVVSVRPEVDVDAPRADAPGGGKGAELDEAGLRRKEAFERGREQGAGKVDDLEKALENQRKNPDSPRARKELDEAIDAVQQDKHAMQTLNRRGEDAASREIREGFNRELKTSYEQAHNTARQRIADEYGVPLEKVKVVKPTNKPGVGGEVEAPDPRGFAKKPDADFKTNPDDYVQTRPGEVDVNGDKVSYDQDVTYRIEQDNVIDPRTGKVESGHVDVPKAEAKRIYDQEFYKSRHNGELPMKSNVETGKMEVDMDKVGEYNRKMDQATTDRLDAEAYGNGDKDLQTAVKGEYKGRDFNDVEGVGKTMEHKQYEWQNEAHQATTEAKGLRTEAENLRSGGDVKGADEAIRKAETLEAKAEGLTEEGYRQTTKQYGNQLEARVDAVNQQVYQQHHGELPMKSNPATGKAEVDMERVKQFVSENRGNPSIRTAEIPPKLEEAVSIMKRTGEPGFSPVEVDLKLAEIGYTPNKVVQQMSSNLESLQKFKGSNGPGIPDVTSPGRITGGFSKGLATQVNNEIIEQWNARGQ